MNKLLVDTDVFSFIFKGDSRAEKYRSHLAAGNPYLCFISVAELYKWSLVRQWGPEKLQSMLNSMKNYNIIEYDDKIAWRWAEITSMKGKPIQASDAWIAAAALSYDLPLLTHNKKHFHNISGLTLI